MYSPFFSTLGPFLGSLPGVAFYPQHLVPAVEPAKDGHPRVPSATADLSSLLNSQCRK